MLSIFAAISDLSVENTFNSFKSFDTNKIEDMTFGGGSKDSGGTSKSILDSFDINSKLATYGNVLRNIGEITALSGCDRLTIGPALIEELDATEGDLPQHLKDNGASKEKPSKLEEDQFRFDHNEDAMATEKLAEGIRNFVIDQNKLEDALSQKL